MGAVKIIYAVQADDGNYAALYIDGVKVLDMETYEFTPKQIIKALIKANVLEYVEIEEVEVEFEDEVKFPTNFSDVVFPNDDEI